MLWEIFIFEKMCELKFSITILSLEVCSSIVSAPNPASVANYIHPLVQTSNFFVWIDIRPPFPDA